MKAAGSNMRVLVSPLNWGLGHAARCIPIIKELIANGCEVIIAADGVCLQLLKSEFPNLTFLTAPAYNIKYSRKGTSLRWKLLRQLPRIVNAIYKEHLWLQKIIKSHRIDMVISDNRFGLYSKKVPCIYISHQLLIKTGNSFSERILQKLHYSVIKKYTECWIPDDEKNGIGGKLSHPPEFPANAKYIGPLSRFENKEEDQKYDLLVILSGPEPQRTILENIIVNELESFNGKSLLVRGNENAEVIAVNNRSIEIINVARAEQLNHLVCQSKVVISRCGYTTVMDLLKLRKKAILIPTPGQTEQEYLAEYLIEKRMFYCIGQDEFSLHEALESFGKESFLFPEYNWEQYKMAVKNLMEHRTF
jgi:uncharacterized protein (TIGR00661 family)